MDVCTADVVATAMAVQFTVFKFDGNADVGRYRLVFSARCEVGQLPYGCFQSHLSILRTSTFRVLFYTRTFGGAGIAVCFVVAAADRIVLHGANAVGIDLFDAVFGGVAGDGQEQEEGDMQGVFHVWEGLLILNDLGLVLWKQRALFICFTQRHNG